MARGGPSRAGAAGALALLLPVLAAAAAGGGGGGGGQYLAVGGDGGLVVSGGAAAETGAGMVAGVGAGVGTGTVNVVDAAGGSFVPFSFSGGVEEFDEAAEAREVEAANRRAAQMWEAKRRGARTGQRVAAASGARAEPRGIEALLDELRAEQTPSAHGQGKHALSDAQLEALKDPETGEITAGTLQLLKDNMARAEQDRSPALPETTGAGISASEFYHDDGSVMADVFTTFDYLEGIRRRKDHPPHSEVEIMALFSGEGGVEYVRGQLEAKIWEVGHDQPTAWPMWSQLGNSWRATGNVGRAIQCFRKALSIKPTDPDVLLNMAVVLQNMGGLNDAELLIREAVSLHPHGVLHNFIMGTILEQQGKLSEAYAMYERALMLQPSFGPCKKKINKLAGRGVVSANASLLVRASNVIANNKLLTVALVALSWGTYQVYCTMHAGGRGHSRPAKARKVKR